MAVPYTFGSATSAIPLSQLDSNFATTITLGNTAIQLGNTVTTLNNMTLVNTTISSGNVTVTNANVTSITATSDSYISGLTVGKGAGAVSTNTAVGASALAANTTGDSLTAIGYQALNSNVTNTNGTAVGYQALLSSIAENNTAVGKSAARNTTTGTSIVAVGTNTMFSNSTGSYNTALGRDALYSNTTATNNTAVGYQAGFSNTTGKQNTFVGYGSGYSFNNTGGADTYNAFFGMYSGNGTTTGSYNTFIGAGAGQSVTTGSKNTILGQYSGNSGGLNITTASNYIVLSDGDGNPRAFVNGNGYFKASPDSTYNQSNGGAYHEFSQNDGSNNTLFVNNRTTASTTNGMVRLDAWTNTSNNTFYALSYYNQGAGAYRFRVADSGNVTNTNNSYGAISDIKLKENITDATPKLDKLCQVRVVNYNLKSNPEHRQLGVIAQELEQVFPSMIEESPDVDAEGNNLGTTTKSVKYSVFVPMLIKAIQELKAEIDALKGQA